LGRAKVIRPGRITSFRATIKSSGASRRTQSHHGVFPGGLSKRIRVVEQKKAVDITAFFRHEKVSMLMRSPRHASLALLLGLTVAVMALPFAAQSEKPATPDKHATSRLRIEVTGGDANKPVPDASVYLRFPEKKKVELDLKTNQEGIARSPEIPQGKVLIQIVVPGWKTYGEYHDVTEAEQTIQIHLVKPPIRWY
jgi:hypothetical protein